MNTANVSERDITSLKTLYQLREKRALMAVSEQRKELSRLEAEKEKQEQIITCIKDELDELHKMRTMQNMQSLSASALVAESTRRHILTQDLEKEEFYLPGFINDVLAAQAELERCEHAWLIVRERAKALTKDRKKRERSQSLRTERRINAR